MGTLGLAAEVCLALVFAVSGAAKLADRDGTRQAVDGFGVPAVLAGPVALLLAPGRGGAPGDRTGRFRSPRHPAAR